MMNTLELESFLRKHNRRSINITVCTAAQLPKGLRKGTEYGFVINQPGEHGSSWISLYVDNRGKCIYFDSCGYEPRNCYISEFIDKNFKTTVYNAQQLRELTSDTCGMYAACFVLHMMSGGRLTTYLIEKVIQSGFVTTKSQLNIAMNELQTRLNLLTTVLGNCFSVIENEIKFDESISMGPVNFSKLVKILILFRQHEIFMKNLIDSLVGTKTMIDCSLKMFRDKLNQIHELVKFRTAIPTEKIFPEFTVLSQYWLRLQDIILLLSEINVVNEELMKFSDSIHPWEDMTYLLLDDKSIERDMERSKEVSVDKYFDDMKIENKGFCTWCLVAGKGSLIDSTIFIRYNNKNYGFVNQWAADQFRRHPQKYLFSIIEIARCNPELIILLDKFDDLKNHRNELHYIGNGTLSLTKANDIDTQTETHPIPCNIDKNYNWNIWELRRNAIKLSNLMKCKTISTQTHVSFGKAEVSVQVFPPKIGRTQTQIDRGSDMVKPISIYLRSIVFDGISDELENMHLIEAIDEQE